MFQCNDQLCSHLATLYGGNHCSYRGAVRKVVTPRWRRTGIQILAPKTKRLFDPVFWDHWWRRFLPICDFFVNSWWCVSPQGCLGLIYSTVGGGGERDLLSICDILFNCYRCWFSARFTLNYLLITLLCMSRSSLIHKTATATLYQKTELLTVATFGYFPNYSVSLKCNYKTDYGN